MKTRLWITLLAVIVAIVMSTPDFAFSRGGGGRGGGGRVGGGGGGFSGGARPSGGFSGGARPSVGSSPSFNRPASRPSTPAARPSTPASRPSMPSTRPSTGAGSRPNVGNSNIGAGNRPGVGSGGSSIGSRPSTLPSRPGSGTGIGSGQGIGSGAGIGNRPGAGTGIANRPGTGTGIANRPGISQLPANRLPGLGAAAGAGALGGAVASRLPNQGARVQDRMANRPSTLEDRRSNLSDRMSNGREDWQQHRNDRQDDRQDWRDNNREDWQNWTDGKLDNYGDWYHGGWQPGDGWGYMWDNYPVAAAIGLTAWGVNRIGYGWGYWGYSNPYYSDGGSYGYDYSEPLVVYADGGSATATATTADPGTPPPSSEPQPTDEGMAAFDEARAAFLAGDYAGALTKIDTTLKTMPRDTVVHEFRALVLFALKKYPESSAAIYAVLSAGPGWDWTTMISLYPGVDPYTKQLRELESFAKANPKSADAQFLLGYQYQTCGYSDNAAKQFKLAQALLSDDKLLKQLVAMTAPVDASKTSDTPPAPPIVPPEKVLKSEQLVGTWKATSQGAAFQLDLAKDGSFVWTYSRGKEKQSVKGAFAVDQNNLALETNDGGGTMLAEIDFANPSQFKFKMIGDGEKEPGLEFKKG